MYARRCRLREFFLATVLAAAVLLLVLSRTDLSRPDQPVHQGLEDPSALSDEVVLALLGEQLPNLPVDFWSRLQHARLKGCAKLPSLLDLQVSNAFWQVLQSSNGTFQLFGAYLDNRKNNRLGPTVRILAMVDRIELAVKTHCQLWFADDVVIAPVIEYKYVWVHWWGNYKQGVYQPYLMACQIPVHAQNSTPGAVSVVEGSCDEATNLLKVIYNKPPEKKDFAVCVKGLDFPHQDLSARLAEWIELLRILGADKIYFYNYDVHPNVQKLLEHYQKEGTVHVTPFTLPGNLPNAPLLRHLFLKNRITHKRQTELIPYNDCFYRHLYEYRYVVLLDIDEVIVPMRRDTWKQLLMDVQAEYSDKKERGSFSVRNVYFLDHPQHSHGWFEGIPEYMHMLQHVYRAKNFTPPGQFAKSFFSTDKALTLHNHSPFSCLGFCYSIDIPTQHAQLQHYRKTCVSELQESCGYFMNHSVMDPSLWRFKSELIQRVTRTLATLDLTPN